jgi:hypothetical protein
MLKGQQATQRADTRGKKISKGNVNAVGMRRRGEGRIAPQGD